jgi:hypothetical protein
MRPITLVDYAALSPRERTQLANTVTQHRGLDDIFTWGRSQVPAVIPTDVVKQDEFTHDVLVPIPSGRWLVYGTT